MNIILSVYTPKAFKEYVLPNINNTNYSIVVEKSIYETSSDMSVRFDVIENQWRVLSDSHYKIQVNGESVSQLNVTDKTKFDIIFECGTVIRVTAALSDADLLNTHKYRICTNAFSIGSSADNDIICNSGFISGKHARIYYGHDGWYIEDLSKNGVFLNSVRVRISTKLKYGDFINVVGLRMVFLNDVIAINGKELSQIKLRSGSFEKLKTAETVHLPEKHKKAEKKFFNRAPRILREFYTDTVEIEAPPSPRTEKQQSLFMTIGPSFTMVIPMLLGSGLMIYSAINSGGELSPFMFMGLITAVASAGLGIFWGMMNYKNRRKSSEGEEKHRFEAYSEYLTKCAEDIREKNHYNCAVMHETYPSAEECLNLSEKSINLWNRNISHNDFLFHRIGLGEVPFQAQIQIPKERFVLYDDSLAEKPALIKSKYETLKNVPIGIDLLAERIVGIVGGEGRNGAYEVMKALSAQIAACNCYTDVKLGYLFGDNCKRESLVFSKWLPHCWSEDKKTRFCSFGNEEMSDVCYELTKIFRLRDEAASESYASKGIAKPHYVVFVENISQLEGEPLAKYMFEPRDEYGLTTVLFAENYEELPNSCECIIYNDGKYTGVYKPTTLSTLNNQVKLDCVGDSETENFARRLANVEVAEIETGGEIPNSLSFLEMYKVDEVEELNVIERWKKNKTYDNMRVLIGQKSGGTDCYLDLHEKYHGPHGLVAGTTGSGKSETIQTYILSLAINYSPEDIGFLLIDFKGGGMANLFTDLPHTLGQISNLSGSQIRRAMVSIKSENLRRQRIFSEHGVNNINAYTRMFKNKEASIPLPHLFIMIDEFAELKREEPEFMSELISVAQVGRSLGVHLILATQKPGGTVDDNIRSNSKFKLCLRVQDKQDSSEMLGMPDAAFLSQAGRCYLQVGNNEVFELFQSGWSGAVYDNSGAKNSNIANLILSNGKTTASGSRTLQKRKAKRTAEWLVSFSSCVFVAAQEISIALTQAVESADKMSRLIDTVFEISNQMNISFSRTNYNEKALVNFVQILSAAQGRNIEGFVLKAIDLGVALPEPKELTQLDVVIDHIVNVARDNGYKKCSSLWLPMLSENLALDSIQQFRAVKYDGKNWNKQPEWNLSAYVGMCDDPENQLQFPLVADLANNGHIAVCGSVTSGKSTFLQTFIWSLINTYSPEQVNIYAIDFSNHMLQPFEKAPHVGGVMYESDSEKIDKFFFMLSQEIVKRKKMIGGGNYGQYVNAHGYKFPSMVVVIDNFSGFTGRVGDKYDKMLWELSRDGAGLGIFLVFSDSGFGHNGIPNRIAENMRNTFAIDLGEKFKYADVIRANHFDVEATSGVKGRGLVNTGSAVLEFQTAVCFSATDDYARGEMISAKAEEMSLSYKGKKAAPVPEIPEKPTWKDISANPQFADAIADKEKLPLAYNSDTASVYSVNLAETFCYIINGKSGSGRTDIMKILAAAAKAKNAEVCIIDSEAALLKATAEKLNINYVKEPEDILKYCTETLLPVFKQRNALKKELKDNGAQDDEIFTRMSEEKPVFIFVGDLLNFMEKINKSYDGIGKMNGFFENLISKGSLHNIYFIFDANMDMHNEMKTYSIYNIICNYKTGIQLGGMLSKQKVFDISTKRYIPEFDKATKPGIGYAFGTETFDKVVIPSSKGM